MFLFPAGLSQSEPVDWLGFSRLGSPDTTLRDAATAKAAAAEKPSATAAAGRDIGRQAESGDGRTSVSKGMPKADKGDSIDDRAEKSNLDWLEMAADRSTKRKAQSSGDRKSLDTTQDDDWLGTRTTQSATEKSDSASDYLGLGTEIDLSHKPLGYHLFLVTLSLYFCL